ncbi:MAG: ATP-binding protein, partial [Herbiconiux sp.]|nr:ATP-binding protein [Herbiconiux sp.]
ALIELDRPEEAVELATAQQLLGQQLADQLLTAVDEPVLHALLLGKSAQAAERGIALEISIPSRVPAGALPPQELITIVGNLVDNAMEAVAGGAPATVRVRVEPAPDALGLMIEVSDSGPGPAPEVAAGLFTLGTTSKADPGHGIGLALVRQAVARQGGTIAVEGSRFTVLLPTAGPANRHADDVPAHPSSRGAVR